MRQEEYDLACVLDYQAEQEWNRQQAKGRREAKDRGEEVEEVSEWYLIFKRLLLYTADMCATIE